MGIQDVTFAVIKEENMVESDIFDGILGLAFHKIAQSTYTTTILDRLKPIEFIVDIKRCGILFYMTHTF